VLKRRFWLGTLAVAAGVVWTYAQGQETSFSLWNFNTAPNVTAPLTTAAPVAATPTTTATTTTQTLPSASAGFNTSATENPNLRIYGPEIWRLPMVNGPVDPVATASASPALAVPPAELVPAPPPAPAASNTPATLSGVLSLEEPIQIKPPKSDVVKLWDGSFDLGLDGTEGNSQTFNFRFGCHGSRKAESNILTWGLDYNKSVAQGNTTADRMFFESRFEWLFHESRWSWFVHETVLYDEFQAFNVQDTSDAGFGYRLIKNDTTTFIGRIGTGFSHEYGGPQNGKYIPEMVFSLQLEHQVSTRQKILGLVEYAPDIDYFGQYRIRAQAAWEVLLDSEKNLSLRVGVLEMYNIPGNGAVPNDLDYAMVLIWKF
jgi:putative salt-induced outer membrane protein YdiY